jgi:hypothetical protein
MPPTPPYAHLTPDAVLDALDSVGMGTDGRLLALNSYENRVYQVGREEGPPVVAKFYRPARWSDAAILEEHAFTRELADLEIPVVPPLVLETAPRCMSTRASASPSIPAGAGACPSSTAPRPWNGWAASSAASMRWAP